MAAFADGWASPRPGVLLGMRPPGGWAECAGCSAGRLDVDLAAARDLAARAWPLDEAARQIRRLAAHLKDVKDRWRDLDASDDSRPALLARVVSAHDMLSSATYVWGTLPALPAQILPADYPHDVLARISAELAGPLMESGSRASARLLAAHRGS